MPYKETSAHGPNFPHPIPEIVEGQEEYEVERVLASRRKGRKKQLQLLIKWKGYPEADNTWEPVEGVFVPQLVKEFYENNPTAIKTAEPPPLLLRTVSLQKPTRLEQENVTTISRRPLLQQEQH